MQQRQSATFRSATGSLKWALAFALLVSSPAAAEKAATFDMDEIVAHMVQGPKVDESRFRGPEGDVIRAEIKALYEGIDDLDDQAYEAREEKILAKRRELFALKIPPEKQKPAKKIVLDAVEAYAKENGFDIAYSLQFLSSTKYSIVVVGNKTDITQAVIARLVESGHADNKSPEASRRVEGFLKKKKLSYDEDGLPPAK